MQAIANLVEDDPFLKLSKADRLEARRQRRAKFAKSEAFDEPKIIPIALPVFIEPKPVRDPTEVWIERQKKIHAAYEPWFSIEAEIDPPQTKLGIRDIQRVVAAKYNVTVTDIISARRTADVVLPRQVAVFLARTLTTHSLPEIGRRFGNRDHTTALHAVRKIEQMLKTHERLRGVIDQLIQALGGPVE